MSIADLRMNYAKGGLRRADLSPDPIVQFQTWFAAVLEAQILEPNAMNLATVDVSGQPSNRTVLLKAADERGFSFFTNYESRKGSELAQNPRAALTFLWKEMERQVCVRGVCARLSREESQAYFSRRPLGSQLGAWVSRQTSVVQDRAFLELQLAEVTARFNGIAVPVPPYWGGFVLAPHEIEFWQGRPNRLHDRFRYIRRENMWLIERLSP